jgi:uncharacterized membrane protein
MSDALTNTERVSAIDIVRGLIMVIMALDHTREFWGATPVRPEDVSQTSALLFFTRWITHLCAPGFIFLSGVSIYLYQTRKEIKSAASVFALTRGAWLIVVEVVLMSFILTHGYNLIVLSILWVIGWCMIFMAGAVWLPRTAIIVIGLLMIAAHNLWPSINPVSPLEIALAAFHNTPFFIPSAGVLVAYTIIPWLGVMMAGYASGTIITGGLKDATFRYLGISLLVFFVIARLLNGYGEPLPFEVQERGAVFTVLSFLNVSKYPPSLLFLSVTLGIVLILLTLFRKKSRLTSFLSVYGKVPFFFFVLHFALLSLASYLWTLVAFGEGVNLAFTNFDQLPEQYEPSLLRVYFVWFLVIVITYLPCRWFGSYKARHRHWWLSYL